MNLDRIGIDCPLYEFDCSDIEFDIGEFYALSPNNGKLTLAHNGVSIGDFTANQQEDETINIVTPTSEDITNAVAGEALLRQQADNTLQSNINAEQLARERADRDIQSVLDGESLARSNADIDLQRQIDAIASKSDVVDVVANYAALQAYDTSKLNDNDVVKVLDDETHGDTMTYYRWNKSTSTWSYIGQEAAYYSKSQMDTLLATKQDNLTAGTGIDITGTTISADTTVLATKSELSNYAEKSDTYTKTEVDNLVEPKLSVEVVENLPATGEENKLYLTEKAKTIQTANGNPITATITDGAGKLSDFRLDGDTFQQSYTGKNLFDKNHPNDAQCYVNNSGVLASGGAQNLSVYIQCEPSTTYTVSKSNAGTNNRFCVFDTQTVPAVGVSVISSVGTRVGADNSTSYTITTGANAHYLGVFYRAPSTTPGESDLKDTIQIEKGSTATSYEPFVGGQASPNPAYPQPIQTVTGTQTITVNGTNYTVNLGTTKINNIVDSLGNNYRDRIYKDGDDWKLHKETGYKFFNTLTGAGAYGVNATSTNTSRAIVNDCLGEQATYEPSEARTAAICNRFENKLNWSTDVVGFFTDTNSTLTKNGLVFRAPKSIVGTTTTSVENWLNANPLDIYFVLATPTDTTITDQTLIAQLEAIRTASLENGSNTLSNSATGSNLAGDMEISYYGYNPTNRYDKWLWLDLNNSYEQLGS